MSAYFAKSLAIKNIQPSQEKNFRGAVHFISKVFAKEAPLIPFDGHIRHVMPLCIYTNLLKSKLHL